MRRAFLTSLFAVFLVACASPSPAGPRRFSGEWEWHFETSSFLTDSGEGPYWLAADGSVWQQLNAPFQNSGAGPWGRAHLVIEGELSAPGAYGHLGAYSRELRVTRVIEARLISTRESSAR
jgi:hypothetical protein